VNWPVVKELQIQAGGLLAGDVLRVVDGTSSEMIVEAPSAGHVRATDTMQAPGFAWIEILRALLPGLQRMPGLISNPIYFEAGQNLP
jgi:hypothetical protein